MRAGVLWLLAVALLGLGCPGGGPVDAGVDAGLPPNTSGWWRDKVVYEVFVRSFADSDGDGVGDLKGLTAKLDYLNDGDPSTTTDLGVDALWLMPIYASSSYHGYDVEDYQAVNSAYGNLADLEALIAAAHRRGLRVILDFVPNHTSSRHPWFVNAQTGPTAEHRDWYVWRDADPGWPRVPDGASLWHQRGDSWFYGYFTSSMPDLNYRNTGVKQAVLDAMKFWVGNGVDGLRIDAARYLVEQEDGGSRGVFDRPESHAVAKGWRAELQRTWPDTLLVAEAWAADVAVAQYYGDGDEYQLAFAFDQAAALVTALQTRSAAPLINVIAVSEATLAGKDRGFQAPFLTNHDMVRVMQQLGGDFAAAKQAAATLLAMPGTPFLYYGEEIGLQGGPSADDRDKRTPMRWTASGPGYGFTSGANGWYGAPEDAGVDVASQQAQPDSLWNTYRSLLALRHAHPALATGEATRVQSADAPAAVFAFLRSGGNERVLYVANFGNTPVSAFSAAVTGAPSVLLSSGAVTVSGDGGTVGVDGLPPNGWAFLTLR